MLLLQLVLLTYGNYDVTAIVFLNDAIITTGISKCSKFNLAAFYGVIVTTVFAK